MACKQCHLEHPNLKRCPDLHPDDIQYWLSVKPAVLLSWLEGKITDEEAIAEARKVRRHKPEE